MTTSLYDYIIAGDTDSLYLKFEPFIYNYISKEKWNNLSAITQKEIVLTLALKLTEDLNKKAYEDIQLVDYNSQEHEFKCEFIFEVIAKSGLFLAKKNYGLWVVWKDGKDVDTYKITGLDIVKSSCPEHIRTALSEILGVILKAGSDAEIRAAVKKYEDQFKGFSPNDIAKNINCNNIDQYVDKDGNPIKGTPNHIKGVLYYKKLAQHLKIEDNYPAIEESSKAKVAYLKKNMFGYDTMTFIEWPKEFDKVISIDYPKMIEKLFINKVEDFLVPIGKESLLSDVDEQLSLFF